MAALVVLWGWVKRAGLWLADHWHVPLIAVAAILGYVLAKRGTARQPLELVKTELDAIAAGAEVRKVKAEAGAQAARAHIEEQHKEALAALDAKQREEAKTYEENPEELARFLVRVGSASKAGGGT